MGFPFLAVKIFYGDAKEALMKSSLPQNLQWMRRNLQRKMLLRRANPAQVTL